MYSKQPGIASGQPGKLAGLPKTKVLSSPLFCWNTGIQPSLPWLGYISVGWNRWSTFRRREQWWTQESLREGKIHSPQGVAQSLHFTETQKWRVTYLRSLKLRVGEGSHGFRASIITITMTIALISTCFSQQDVKCFGLFASFHD